MVAAIESRTTPQTLLIGWANKQDAWVRYIVGEVLASKQYLDSPVLDKAYNYLLVEKELKDGPSPRVPQLTVSGEQEEGVQTLQLLRLGDLDGVNALTTGQEVVFHSRLTLLFGENAAGKSGYVRVLKRLAAVRSTERVLPNMLAGGKRKPQGASVTYNLDGEERTHQWKGEAGVSPFTRLTVFDAKAVSVHLDDDLTYVYTPRDLALFRIVHDTIDTVQQELDKDLGVILPRGNPFASSFTRGTSVYSKIETLGPQTDVDQLKRLATLSEQEVEQLPHLRSKVDALRSHSDDFRLRSAITELDLIKRIGAICGAVKAFDWRLYNSGVQLVETANNRHESATVTAFRGMTTSGVLSEEWRNFIEAGEIYIRSLALDDYPTEGAVCTYCNQPLHDAAVSLIHKYRDFTNNQLKEEVTTAQAALEALASSIVGLAIKEVGEAISNRIAVISEDVPKEFALAQEFLEAAAGIQVRLRNGRRIATAASEALNVLTETLGPLLTERGTAAEELVTTLTSEVSDREKLLRDCSYELKNLEARLKLRQLITEVEQYVKNAKWAASATRVRSTFAGLSRSLTVVSKAASQDLVNQDFARLFIAECKALRAPEVKLDFPGRDAQPKRRKTLVPRHTLSDILSEGEQKVIALADFLAEAGMPQTNAPVVFDDPVNSLDYKRLQYVVNRIVELSNGRQVVVFTHNIWFAAELLSRFEKNPGDCKYYEVSYEDQEPGKIEELQHPKWDTPKRIAKQINSRIQMAKMQTGVMRDDLIRGTWSQIRSWCETFIEQEVLAGVTARYRPHVRMTTLPRIRGDLLEQTTRSVLPIFEKACRMTDAHSQPLETLGIKPSLDELEEDWATLQAARKEYLT